jgi:uncharacterized Zn finger protein
VARETKEEKAARLIINQAVRFKTHSPTVAFATIRGDNDDYEVWRDERGRWTCSCAYGRHSCAHIVAARSVYRSFYGRY